MNKTPKLLPWLARKAGISNEKAAALWREVVSDESLHAGGAKDPDHTYHAIVARLHEMADSEKSAAKPATVAHSPLLVLSRHGNGPAAVLLNPFGLKIA